jgi:hypothetical protein
MTPVHVVRYGQHPPIDGVVRIKQLHELEQILTT